MRVRSLALCATKGALVSTLVGVFSANATVVVNIVQTGTDVVATANGSLVTSGLTQNGGITYSARDLLILSGLGSVVLGAVGPASYFYAQVIGPSTFGSAFNNFDLHANVSTGSSFGFGAVSSPYFPSFISLPTGYVSGTPISSMSTWTDTTLAELYLHAGTYAYSYGTGVSQDSIVVTVAVPEPTPLVLMLIGVGMVGFMASKSYRM